MTSPPFKGGAGGRSAEGGERDLLRDGTGIETRGTGGACLVQLAEDLGGPKTCKTGEFVLPMNGVNGWFGYNGPDGRCWVKPPKPNACNRTLEYLPNGPRRWDVGTFRSNVDSMPLAGPPGKTTSWRVIACLNGYDENSKPDSKDSRDCGIIDGTNRREVWGDVVQITVPPPVILPDLSMTGELRTGASPPAPNPGKVPAGGISVNTQ